MFRVLISSLIGLLGLDTTIAFQVMISQPIFSAGILGVVYGNLPAALEIGMMMQLLWLGIVPAGATVFPEGNIGSMITCAIVLDYYHLEIPNLVFATAFAGGIITSYIGAYVTVADRKINGRILGLTLAAARKARFNQITLLNLLSIIIYFILMSLLAYFALFVGDQVIEALQTYLPASLDKRFSLLKPAVWGLGIALIVPILYREVKQHLS